MAELNKEFVVSLQGKDFVTFNGLMDLAHQMKLQSITTELVQIPNEENGSQCIMKAVATTEDGKVFEGYGDADPSNVNSMIARHSIRMAETRAKARALRDLTNVGMTAFEELGGEEDTPVTNKSNSNERNSNLSEGQIKRLYAIGYAAGFSSDQINKSIRDDYKKSTANQLTRKEYDELCNRLEKAKKTK